MDVRESMKLFERAMVVTPGGTFDPMRMTGTRALAFARGDGSHVWDVDGNEFVDYHLSFGPLVLGHRHPKVVSAVSAQLEQGDIWNAGLNELEVEVAEAIQEHIPSAERVRFCVTGSDGILFAIRLSRAHTRRKKIIKFIGGYHGNNDNVLVDVSPSLHESGRIPHLESSGLDPSVASNTITVPFNNPEAVERAFAQNKGEIAALITEPIMHSAVGCITPAEGFLKFLREVTERNGSLLVFDEVITGFRHAIGGVQSIFGITPDLSVVAKALANGFPIAAICGKKEVMSEFQPLGNVVEFGTYIAHPISLAAAKATLSILETGTPYEQMTASATLAKKGITDALEEHKIDGHVAGFRSIIAVYFTRHEIKTYSDLSYNDMEMATRFKEGLLSRGILTLPLPLKRMHFSCVHTEADVKKLVESSNDAIASLKPGKLIKDRASHQVAR